MPFYSGAKNQGMTGVTADCDVRHFASQGIARRWTYEKEAAMVYQDFLFLTLMVIFLYFAKREAGHWKH
jgi:hypothetical protein